MKEWVPALGCQAEVVPFIDDMARRLRRADLVVARSGAMTVTEIALAARPAIFVPYPFHRDRQQELNARVIERRGAAVIVDDDEQLGANLAARCASLIADPRDWCGWAQQAPGGASPTRLAHRAVVFRVGWRERAA